METCAVCFGAEFAPGGSESVRLGPCGHEVCLACALGVAHSALDHEEAFPRCTICGEASSLAVSATRYGIGWLQYEAVERLHKWSTSPEVAGDAAARGGQAPLSSDQLARYTRMMVFAALSEPAGASQVGDIVSSAVKLPVAGAAAKPAPPTAAGAASAAGPAAVAAAPPVAPPAASMWRRRTTPPADPADAAAEEEAARRRRRRGGGAGGGGGADAEERVSKLARAFSRQGADDDEDEEGGGAGGADDEDDGFGAALEEDDAAAAAGDDAETVAAAAAAEAAAAAAAAAALLPAAPSERPVLRRMDSAPMTCPNPACGCIQKVPPVDKPQVAQCLHCEQDLCMKCGRAWLHAGSGSCHIGLSCEDFASLLEGIDGAAATRKAFLSSLDPSLLATVGKECPRCGMISVHYRNHGCHHVNRSRGCVGCGYKFCFVCLEHDCPDCPLMCDDTCDCPVCPDCKPGDQCNACSGPPCPSCCGETPEQCVVREARQDAAREAKIKAGWCGPRARRNLAELAAESGASIVTPIQMSSDRVADILTESVKSVTDLLDDRRQSARYLDSMTIVAPADIFSSTNDTNATAAATVATSTAAAGASSSSSGVSESKDDEETSGESSLSLYRPTAFDVGTGRDLTARVKAVMEAFHTANDTDDKLAATLMAYRKDKTVLMHSSWFLRWPGSAERAAFQRLVHAAFCAAPSGAFIALPGTRQAAMATAAPHELTPSELAAAGPGKMTADGRVVVPLDTFAAYSSHSSRLQSVADQDGVEAVQHALYTGTTVRQALVDRFSKLSPPVVVPALARRVAEGGAASGDDSGTDATPKRTFTPAELVETFSGLANTLRFVNQFVAGGGVESGSSDVSMALRDAINTLCGLIRDRAGPCDILLGCAGLEGVPLVLGELRTALKRAVDTLLTGKYLRMELIQDGDQCGMLEELLRTCVPLMAGNVCATPERGEEHETRLHAFPEDDGADGELPRPVFTPPPAYAGMAMDVDGFVTVCRMASILGDRYPQQSLLAAVQNELRRVVSTAAAEIGQMGGLATGLRWARDQQMLPLAARLPPADTMDPSPDMWKELDEYRIAETVEGLGDRLITAAHPWWIDVLRGMERHRTNCRLVTAAAGLLSTIVFYDGPTASPSKSIEAFLQEESVRTANFKLSADGWEWAVVAAHVRRSLIDAGALELVHSLLQDARTYTVTTEPLFYTQLDDDDNGYATPPTFVTGEPLPAGCEAISPAARALAGLAFGLYRYYDVAQLPLPARVAADIAAPASPATPLADIPARVHRAYRLLTLVRPQPFSAIPNEGMYQRDRVFYTHPSQWTFAAMLASTLHQVAGIQDAILGTAVSAASAGAAAVSDVSGTSVGTLTGVSDAVPAPMTSYLRDFTSAARSRWDAAVAACFNASADLDEAQRNRILAQAWLSEASGAKAWLPGGPIPLAATAVVPPGGHLRPAAPGTLMPSADRAQTLLTLRTLTKLLNVYDYAAGRTFRNGLRALIPALEVVAAVSIIVDRHAACDPELAYDCVDFLSTVVPCHLGGLSVTERIIPHVYCCNQRDPQEAVDFCLVSATGSAPTPSADAPAAGAASAADPDHAPGTLRAPGPDAWVAPPGCVVQSDWDHPIIVAAAGHHRLRSAAGLVSMYAATMMHPYRPRLVSILARNVGDIMYSMDPLRRSSYGHSALLDLLADPKMPCGDFLAPLHYLTRVYADTSPAVFAQALVDVPLPPIDHDDIDTPREAADDLIRAIEQWLRSPNEEIQTMVTGGRAAIANALGLDPKTGLRVAKGAAVGAKLPGSDGVAVESDLLQRSNPLDPRTYFRPVEVLPLTRWMALPGAVTTVMRLVCHEVAAHGTEAAPVMLTLLPDIALHSREGRRILATTDCSAWMPAEWLDEAWAAASGNSAAAGAAAGATVVPRPAVLPICAVLVRLFRANDHTYLQRRVAESLAAILMEGPGAIDAVLQWAPDIVGAVTAAWSNNQMQDDATCNFMFLGGVLAAHKGCAAGLSGSDLMYTLLGNMFARRTLEDTHGVALCRLITSLLKNAPAPQVVLLHLLNVDATLPTWRNAVRAPNPDDEEDTWTGAEGALAPETREATPTSTAAAGAASSKLKAGPPVLVRNAFLERMVQVGHKALHEMKNAGSWVVRDWARCLVAIGQVEPACTAYMVRVAMMGMPVLALAVKGAQRSGSAVNALAQAVVIATRPLEARKGATEGRSSSAATAAASVGGAAAGAAAAGAAADAAVVAPPTATRIPGVQPIHDAQQFVAAALAASPPVGLQSIHMLVHVCAAGVVRHAGHPAANACFAAIAGLSALPDAAISWPPVMGPRGVRWPLVRPEYPHINWVVDHRSRTVKADGKGVVTYAASLPPAAATQRRDDVVLYVRGAIMSHTATGKTNVAVALKLIKAFHALLVQGAPVAAAAAAAAGAASSPAAHGKGSGKHAKGKRRGDTSSDDDAPPAAKAGGGSGARGGGGAAVASTGGVLAVPALAAQVTTDAGVLDAVRTLLGTHLMQARRKLKGTELAELLQVTGLMKR